MDLNHQKVRVPGEPVRCRLCGAHFDETIQGICPARVVRFVAPHLLESVQEEVLGALQEEVDDPRPSLYVRNGEDMRIIEPSYVIEQCPSRKDVVQQIEEAGRTCYKSEDRVTADSGAKFVRMLLKRGHETVIEHVGMTVRFVCNRGISHEIVRHRLSSLSQESSRYCDYSKGKHGSEITVINDNHTGEALEVWMKVIETCEWGYMRLLELGIKPEMARNVLPIALKTEIVMTCNMREWRHVFRLRASRRAHPQMRQLMLPLLDEMIGHIPELFEDLREESHA